MGSKRLPGKTLLQLGNKTVLEWTIDRLKMCRLIDRIVVATSLNPSDDPIADLCISKDISCFRGSEDDVLDRVAQACQLMSADVVVQAGADCPLYDPDITDELIDFYLRSDYHYVCNDFQEGYPIGVAPHVFGFKTLYEINQMAISSRDRENVVTFLWDHPDKYRVFNLEPPEELRRPDIRLTVDYKEDFEFIDEIIKGLGSDTFRTRDVINFLEQNNHLLDINKNCRMKKESVAYSHYLKPEE